jgi:hypothetical protein
MFCVIRNELPLAKCTGDGTPINAIAAPGAANAKNTGFENYLDS